MGISIGIKQAKFGYGDESGGGGGNGGGGGFGNHRFWRLNITANEGDQANTAILDVLWTDLAEQVVPKPGSVVVTASSAYSSFIPSHCYNNNNNNFWASGTGQQVSWVQFDFGDGAAFDMNNVFLTPRNDSFYTQAPSDFTVEYSDNGVDWEVAWGIVGATWSQGQQQAFPA